MSQDSHKTPWPLEILYSESKRELNVIFDNDEKITVPAELLRVESPSAEVQGHSPSQKKIITNKENVKITAIDPVGRYAIKITFDDGHNTGIYTWSYLYELGLQKDEKLASYKKAVASL